MIRNAIAALALCAVVPAAAEDVAPGFRYLGKNEMGAAMVATMVFGPQTERSFTLVLAASTVRPTGADNYVFQFAANCTDRTYRYSHMIAYIGDRKLGEQEGGMAFETPEPGSLNEQALTYACTGVVPVTDTTVVYGIPAARLFAFGKAKAR